MNKEDLKQSALDDAKITQENAENTDNVEDVNTETTEVEEADKDTEIQNLNLKLKEAQDSYLRTYADFDNTKKRLEREKFQALEYAYEKIAKDLLPIADTLQKAKESAEVLENGTAVAEGIALTLSNLEKTLQKHGIEIIETNGEFDPNMHDAIMQVESDLDEGHIVSELQRGYKYKDRILRPALVSVAKAK